MEQAGILLSWMDLDAQYGHKILRCVYKACKMSICLVRELVHDVSMSDVAGTFVDKLQMCLPSYNNVRRVTRV